MGRPTRTSPLVLGLVRPPWYAGGDCELILRRDGSCSVRSLRSGLTVDGWSLHEASDWLRGYVVGSA